MGALADAWTTTKNAAKAAGKQVQAWGKVVTEVVSAGAERVGKTWDKVDKLLDSANKWLKGGGDANVDYTTKGGCKTTTEEEQERDKKGNMVTVKRKVHSECTDPVEHHLHLGLHPAAK